MIPRNEYPRPQMVRSNWINLNGEWEFDFDFGCSGKERGMQNAAHLEKAILVPFCPESSLSGIGYKDFMPAVWYRRTFEKPQLAPGYRLLLHFEAVDYRCEVWINGISVGTHTGGYTPFSFDITEQLQPGTNVIVLCAEDDCRQPMVPRGKQSESFYSKGCDYTRTTGIWQTVWMEITPADYIREYRATGDALNGAVRFDVFFSEARAGRSLEASVTYEGKSVGTKLLKASDSQLSFSVELSELHLWQPGEARLYDVTFRIPGGDEITGYFGLRSLDWSGSAITVNGKPVFQRLVLDQGFYPDGIYTAPDDAALKKDIELSMAMGFNGARLHQKVFERRFLYWADKLGYLVWGEYGSWGMDVSSPAALESFLPQWLESVQRDYNSPALVGWCPFNETWDYHGRRQDDLLLLGIYHATKAADPTRPVIDTSGPYHVITDIFDVHDYEQDVERFAASYATMGQGTPVYNNYPDRQKYEGQPYFVSEYGGIFWDNEKSEEGWGYGNAPTSMEEYTKRYVGLTRVLMDNPCICALCYTQLYDVEQEHNGIYTYRRALKFPEEYARRMRQAMTAPAAIEKQS